LATERCRVATGELSDIAAVHWPDRPLFELLGRCIGCNLLCWTSSPLSLPWSVVRRRQGYRCCVVVRSTQARSRFVSVQRRRREPRPRTPDELRWEGVGVSGALKCFFVFRRDAQDLTFEFAWTRPRRRFRQLVVVSSLGRGRRRRCALAGTGLELLRYLF